MRNQAGNDPHQRASIEAAPRLPIPVAPPQPVTPLPHAAFTLPAGLNRLFRLILFVPLLVLAVSLGMTYALWRDAQNNAPKALETEFEFRTLEVAERIRHRMAENDQVLRSLRGLFEASESVQRDEFHKYVSALNLAKRYPGIQGLAFVPLVPNVKKNQHIAAIRREDFPEYTIWPAGKRKAYTPVIYIEPFSGRNLHAFGFDLYSEPARHAAMERARDTDTTVITERLKLVQDRDQQAKAGFLMLLPVYQRGAPHATLAERRSNLVGWVYTVFRAEELMAGILGKGAKELDVEIFDREALSDRTLLYDDDKIFRAGGDSGSLFQTTQRLEIAGRTWTVLVSSLPAFENRLRTNKSQLIAQSGIVVSLLLALMTWILAHGRVRSMRAAHALNQELNARRQAEESLRLASMVYENSSEGMLVTDANNHIVAVNPAFTRITGYELNEVLGKDPSYLSSGHHNPDFYQAMWNELNHTGRWQGEIWDRRKNGELHAKYFTINTILDANGSVYRRVALFLDITEKKQSEQFIWHQANFDALTQLPNRSMFNDRLAQEIKKAHRSNQLFALLFIDLDLFKEINDTLGHQVGDLLLVEAAQRITTCVREVDTVARLGGDEFTVILSELHDADNIDYVAEKILEKLAVPYTLGEAVVHVSGSMGITLYPNDASDPEGLLKNADQAMYVAKNMGRNRFSYFTPALQEAAQTRLRMITDLREAIDKKQFIVHYQPIVELATGDIRKAEALIRWQHPGRGLVSPNEFIPLAEETGLIAAIGDGVFREAARQTKRLRALHHPAFQISVNKSPTQFRDSGSTVAAWFGYLRELELPGESITIEITEGLLLNAVADVTDKLQSLRDGGIQIAIDDFGTGYSSLAYLKRFHIDYLKIDQSFVRDIETDPNDMALSNAIIVMAHALGLKVIAEGVETASQFKWLKDAGCDYAQGYFFSKPQPADQFEAWLRARSTWS
ncbi:MAG: bifunctional diguanylate cyclase/phosphodiesterase [Thiobacillus sp.]